MSSMVWVSNAEDPHFEFVRPHLQEEPIVVDPARRPLTIVHAGGHATTIYDGRELKNIRSVWWRRPYEMTQPLVDGNVTPEHREYSLRSIREHIRLLQTAFPEAGWVSDPYTIRRGEDKSLQLELAAAVGLRSPDTVITSDRAVGLAFLQAHPATIVKTLCPPFVTDDRFVGYYARRVHGADRVDLTHLRWGPSIFQQAIDAIADLRVTVVGDEVFTARIDADPATVGQAGLRDWRYHANERGQRFYPSELPAATRDACLELTRRLGLRFGAIDLVLDRDEAIFFLEINPNGQWGFIEEDTHQPIGAALAGLLERG